MRRIPALALALTTTAALAHEGVKNPSVMARMHGMKTIGAQAKVLGEMAKGTTVFEAARAQAAATTLAQEAERIKGLFEAREDDPKSEALPVVWDTFPDFTAKAQTLQIAAESAQTITTQEQLQTAMRDIGATCSACHKAYRKP
ncbi:MAG: cytochrome c [Paracoccaceae bacterium]